MLEWLLIMQALDKEVNSRGTFKKHLFTLVMRMGAHTEG